MSIPAPAAWPETCPECDAGPDAITGVEFAGVYDGVLFWQCIGCGHPMHRFLAGDRRHDLADPFVQRRLCDPDPEDDFDDN